MFVTFDPTSTSRCWRFQLLLDRGLVGTASQRASVVRVQCRLVCLSHLALGVNQLNNHGRGLCIPFVYAHYCSVVAVVSFTALSSCSLLLWLHVCQMALHHYDVRAGLWLIYTNLVQLSSPLSACISRGC